ncbi:MAG: alpha-L-fucosidase [Candidatus Moduliflexus flocculans]|nr:alpha-L-fucosidase [Candidatus Moduliflexus flocculans]
MVSKGGNFLLNIGPSPEGEFAPEALDRLREIGEWMKVNGEAIYGTRPVAPYKEVKTCFTAAPRRHGLRHLPRRRGRDRRRRPSSC